MPPSPSTPGRARLRAFLPAFAMGAIAGGLVGLLTGQDWALDPELERYAAARERIERDFVGGASSEQLLDDALDGMARGLDEYSRWYDADEARRLNAETQGSQWAVGLLFEGAPEAGQVLFALPGSPAELAGLRPGDRVLSAENVPFAEFVRSDGWSDPAPAARLLHLEVESASGAKRSVELRSELCLVPSVRHARLLDEEHGVAYLALRSFTQQSPAEFDRAFEDLRGQGARSWIVDLRGNLGGLLESATRIANRFVSRGTLLRTITRANQAQGGEALEARAAEAHFAGAPLVLLVDRTTASAAEVLAGALQDHAAAVLVGETTYGKGAVQSAAPLPGGPGVLKLTTAYYTTPSGRILDREHAARGRAGLAPDLEVAASAQECAQVADFLNSFDPTPGDRALLEAREAELGRHLLPRPGPDARLDAACALLRGERPAPAPLARNEGR